MFYHRFRWFIRLFYYCGLSPRLTPAITCSSSVSIKRKIPSLICLIVSTAHSVCGLVLVNTSIGHKRTPHGSGRSLEDIITNIFLLCDSIKYLCVYTQSFFMCSLMIGILQNLHSINRLFTDYLHWHIDYRQLVKSYTSKFVVVLLGYILCVTSFAIDWYRRPGLYLVLWFKIWQLTSTLSLIHVVFYVDLVQFHLKQLNALVRSDERIPIHVLMRKNWKGTIMMKKIKCYKTIHYRLWEVAQKIGCVFGWTIYALLLHGFIDSTNSMFWLYSHIRRHRSFVGITSNNYKLLSLSLIVMHFCVSFFE